MKFGIFLSRDGDGVKVRLVSDNPIKAKEAFKDAAVNGIEGAEEIAYVTHYGVEAKRFVRPKKELAPKSPAKKKVAKKDS